MALSIKKVDVWAGELRDIPGGLADVLGGLSDAGGDFQFVIARRDPANPGSGQVFITPIKGKKVEQAAAGVGMNRADAVPTLRVEGGDRPRLGHEMARSIAEAGINIRGFSAAVIGNKFVAYIGFDSQQDADRAASALKSAGRTGSRRKPAAKSRRTRR